MTGTTQTTALQQQTLADTSSGALRTISFNQFDPALGTLVDVRIGLAGDVGSTFSVENLGAAASTVLLTLPSVLQLYAPSGAEVAFVAPDPTANVNLGAYDGSADFSGTSGTVVAGLTSTSSTQAIYTPGSADLAAFTGTSTVSLSLGGSMLSSMSGDANLLSQLQSHTGAVVSLQYDYVAAGSGGGGGGGGSRGFTLVTRDAFPSQLFFPGSSTTTTQTFTLPDATSDWTRQVAVTRFDPSLGTLLAVNISLTGDLASGFAAENLGDTGVTVSGTETASIDLALPGGGSIVAVPTIATQSFTLGTYDGTADFAGTSGASAPGLAGVDGGSISSFDDAADLAAFTGTGAQTLSITALGRSVVDGSGNLLAQITQQSGGTITVSYTYDPPCFAEGTRIATPHGPVAVEVLQVGQRVSLAWGGDAPIVWVGRRTVDCQRHRRPKTVWPVRIRAGAFAPQAPARDLLLSPDHAVFVEDVLIPIRHLVNGDTVVQQPVDQVIYYHLELGQHAVLLAENLPAESFLDTGNRAAFENGGRVTQLHPDFRPLIWEGAGCAPLVVTGAPVAAARARLRDRALTRAAQPGADGAVTSTDLPQMNADAR